MDLDVEKLVRENIDKTIHMSLATVRDGRPWVSEVHFAYDEDLNLYYRSLTTRRHSEEIAVNHNVAGDIVRQHELGEYPTGVYFEGTAERLPDGSEQHKAAKCIQKRLEAGDGILVEAARADGHQFYKITVSDWYVFGKFNGVSGQKYHLPWNNGSVNV